jgi:hypothetical protein
MTHRVIVMAGLDPAIMGTARAPSVTTRHDRRVKPGDDAERDATPIAR